MKNDNTIIKASTGYIIGNYLLKGITFFSVPIFAHLMSTAEYGQYNEFIAYESIIYILIGFAIHSSYKNAKYKYENHLDQYISSSLLLVLCSAIVWGLFVFLFKFLGIGEKSLLYYELLIVYSSCSAIITCFNSRIVLDYEYKKFIFIALFNAIFGIGISIWLIKVPLKNQVCLGRILGGVIPLVFSSIYIVWKAFKREKPRNNKSYWKWGIKYSAPIIPHGISQIILLQFDRVMIKNMVSDSAAGIYSFAYNIYSIIEVTASSVANVIVPWFYEKMKNCEYDEIRKGIERYTVFLTCLSVEMILICPEVIVLLGGDKYVEASYSAIPIIAGGFFSLMYTIPSCFEYYFEKTKSIAIGTVGAAMINILLNFWFISKCGYLAAAYTTLFTYCLYFLFHSIIARRLYRKEIYNKVFLFFSILVLFLFVIISLLAMERWKIRWGCAFVLGIIIIIYEEKTLGLLKKVKNEKR